MGFEDWMHGRHRGTAMLRQYLNGRERKFLQMSSNSIRKFREGSLRPSFGLPTASDGWVLKRVMECRSICWGIQFGNFMSPKRLDDCLALYLQHSDLVSESTHEQGTGQMFTGVG
jgi:hypothetical protein